MREIQVDAVRDKIKELFLEANYNISSDILSALQKARDNETSPTGRSVLDMLLQNYEVASGEEIAICQDTGLAIIFMDIGQEIQFVGGELDSAINEGVKQAYIDGYLRKSAVSDPVFDRKNTGTNTPAIIYASIVPGDKLNLLVTPKGFGSENMSALAMLKPADGVEGIKQFIVETVRKAGPNPCPPTIVGVGIGATADKAMVIAKQATLRPINEHNPDERYAKLEKEALIAINALGIGPAGLGGNTTSLGVNVDFFPTHIAGMPVAVNICCHAARHAKATL